MKRILLVFTIIALAHTSFAQFSFGPKIGYNTSKLSVDRSDIETNLKNSFQFGLFARFGKKYYLQPEINWLTQGGVFNNPDDDASGLSPFKQEIALKTVQVPVMVGIKLINLSILNLRAQVGPVANFVTDKEIESDQIQGYIQPIEQADLKDIFWSAQLGLGVDVLMFTLDVRYNLGLSKVINDVETKDERINFDSKPSGFNISLGWKIF
ncbi:MAG: PorT family protein [Bacteroidales bacterium]|nr:PorT family protein [Bacteroidales bacterium]MCF8344922.1 PorT family protein [Bacteroidales bacterium]MCF8349711.1 PorT family protein [Bacteroidales bacterium]MCF8376688.1 PorT family protein [Bacteroidales bacterium]MCF8401771.1 PorT family protein [Bacteroidales bacterium]